MARTSDPDGEAAENKDGHAIPKGRLRRSAKLGGAVGRQGARYMATIATNVPRRRQVRRERLEERHLETAEHLVDTLGRLKAVSMKLGQLASFVDTDFIPESYRPLYQEKLATLRTSAPAMPWEQIEGVLESEYGCGVGDLFAEFDPDAFAAASIGQVHRASLPDGRDVAVKIQYPGIEAAMRADLSNAGILMRLAKAIAPSLDARAVATELRERVMEELDYELEAQNQRMFSRAYRGHPFIRIPDVVSRLSRHRVLVTEYVEGMNFDEIKSLDSDARSRVGEIVFRFNFGSLHRLQHFNADAHPGNAILLPDGRMAFVDFGMTKHVDREQIDLEIRALDAAAAHDPERLQTALQELGFITHPTRIDAERLTAQARQMNGWHLVDKEVEITPEIVMESLSATSDPRSGFYGVMRRENMPANELLGVRMHTGVLAVLGQLRAKRNWYRISREWWYGDPPSTELGEEEAAFFAKHP